MYDSGFKGRDIHIDESRADDAANSSNNSSFSDVRTSLNASMALLSDASTSTSSAQRLDMTANHHHHHVDDDSAQQMFESSVQESSDHNAALNESQQMSFSSDGEQQHYPYFPGAEALSQVADGADYSYYEGIEYDEDMELQRALALSLIEGVAVDDDVDMQLSGHATESAQRWPLLSFKDIAFFFYKTHLHIFILVGEWILLSTYPHRHH